MNKETESRPPRGMWRRALWYAERTPEERNRYVDFLRALSILAVVLGHWLISAPYLAPARRPTATCSTWRPGRAG